MATSTLTSQQQSPTAKASNPQLKRLVYSKYREMLGSYNGKANTIIQSLPDYMVKEDHGFHFDCIEDMQNDHHHHQIDSQNSR